jgi:hypothetical protein
MEASVTDAEFMEDTDMEASTIFLIFFILPQFPKQPVHPQADPQNSRQVR